MPLGWRSCARRGSSGDQRLWAQPSQRAGDQAEDVAAEPAAIPPVTAQLHTPPTKPSIFVCSTNRLSGIFLRL